MKRLPKGSVAWLICVAIALALQTAMGYVVFQADLIEAARRLAPGPIMATAILVVTRVFLYFFAPGWALYVAARALLERRREAGAREPRA